MDTCYPHAPDGLGLRIYDCGLGLHICDCCWAHNESLLLHYRRMNVCYDRDHSKDRLAFLVCYLVVFAHLRSWKFVASSTFPILLFLAEASLFPTFGVLAPDASIPPFHAQFSPFLGAILPFLVGWFLPLLAASAQVLVVFYLPLHDGHVLADADVFLPHVHAPVHVLDEFGQTSKLLAWAAYQLVLVNGRTNVHELVVCYLMMVVKTLLLQLLLRLLLQLLEQMMTTMMK